jgi:hypothetical protein
MVSKPAIDRERVSFAKALDHEVEHGASLPEPPFEHERGVGLTKTRISYERNARGFEFYGPLPTIGHPG